LMMHCNAVAWSLFRKVLSETIARVCNILSCFAVPMIVSAICVAGRRSLSVGNVGELPYSTGGGNGPDEGCLHGRANIGGSRSGTGGNPAVVRGKTHAAARSHSTRGCFVPLIAGSLSRHGHHRSRHFAQHQIHTFAIGDWNPRHFKHMMHTCSAIDKTHLQGIVKTVYRRSATSLKSGREIDAAGRPSTRPFRSPTTAVAVRVIAPHGV
jgi:hypothetical protein